MKRWFCWWILLCLLPVCASADRQVRLPNSRYTIDVPEYMRRSEPGPGDAGVFAFSCEMMEINYSTYSKQEALDSGMPENLLDAAKDRAARGAETELRSVNGIEMLCFRTVDEADGAPCIGYVFEDGEWLVEVDFWYANDEAARLAGKVISSIREAE